MKQLYLCGAISNNPRYEKDFEEAYNKLTRAGYSVINPLFFCNQKWSWEECIKKCLIVLCSYKNLGIAQIQTPYTSKGAELELQVCTSLGYKIKPVDKWVNEKGEGQSTCSETSVSKQV